jgi:intracellular septation protein
MRVLIDFFPIGLFFAAYKLHDIYTATAVLMAATVVQMGLVYAVDRRLQTMHKATLVLVLLFGALTLALRDDRFIKWKPTVLYAGMALGLALAMMVWKKNVLQQLIGSHLKLPAPVWTRLTAAWIGYFLFMSASNAVVAAFFSTDAWMNFKLWGYAFPLLFLVGQGLYIAPHLKEQGRP